MKAFKTSPATAPQLVPIYFSANSGDLIPCILSLSIAQCIQHSSERRSVCPSRRRWRYEERQLSSPVNLFGLAEACLCCEYQGEDAGECRARDGSAPSLARQNLLQRIV